MNTEERVNLAKSVLDIEVEGLRRVGQTLDQNFSRAIDLIHGRRGKLVVVGIGKSGIVGRKIASTLTSTGNPTVFLHPAEGVHGDLGIVQRGDVAIVISNSGTNPEILYVLEPLKRIGVPIVALTANHDSELAKTANVVLDIGVPMEACPMGLAPTASTTAAMALGDALAVVLLEESGFTPEDYAYLHPGGALGRKLKRVRDVMQHGDAIPTVGLDTPMPNVLVEMSEKRLGITAVLDADGRLAGVISDGDLRRNLERDPKLLTRTAGETMSAKPKTISANALAAAAIPEMEEFKITVLFVVDDHGAPVGAVHLHDLLGASRK